MKRYSNAPCRTEMLRKSKIFRAKSCGEKMDRWERPVCSRKNLNSLSGRGQQYEGKVKFVKFCQTFHAEGFNHVRNGKLMALLETCSKFLSFRKF